MMSRLEFMPNSPTHKKPFDLEELNGKIREFF
jgi:hypothetical protein